MSDRQQKAIDFLDDQYWHVLKRHTALLNALAALEQQMRNADKSNRAVAMADREWANQLQALRTEYGGTE